MSNGETIVAVLTPPGRAAIATLGLRGPEAWFLCRKFFRPRTGTLPEQLDDGVLSRFWLGRLGAELQDEAVLTVKRLDPLEVEMHGHGGVELQSLLLELFAQAGARVATWSEWLTAGETTSWRGLAAEALAHAPTLRCARILLDQYRGAFERELAAIEGCVQRGDLMQASERVAALRRHEKLGAHLTRPWRVVVAGAPNVGKSSLVNALAGFQRCVVAPEPGTTRDLVAQIIAVDGWPVELIDTAGLRGANETLEVEGVTLSRDALQAADCCLWVVDGSNAPLWPEHPPASVLYVVNKKDLPQAWDLEQARDAILVSALTGEGLAELLTRLSRQLVPNPPAVGEAVPFHAKSLKNLLGNPTLERGFLT